MRWSLNIGTIAGTAVRVHITFLLFLGWIFAANYASGGPDAYGANRTSWSPVVPTPTQEDVRARPERASTHNRMGRSLFITFLRMSPPASRTPCAAGRP